MKNIFVYVGLALIVVGAVVGNFTGIGVAMWIELAGFAFGLASCVIGIVKKSEKHDWKLYLSIVAISAGTILLAFAGITESVIVSVITAVIGLVVLIIGILPAMVSFKKK